MAIFDSAKKAHEDLIALGSAVGDMVYVPGTLMQCKMKQIVSLIPGIKYGCKFPPEEGLHPHRMERCCRKKGIQHNV